MSYSMRSFTAAAVLSAIAPAVATAGKQYFFDNIPASQELVWYPCNQMFECARLSVPLNPLEPDNGLRSEIPVIKHPAAKSNEYKGIILTNPGGPGLSGVSFILETGTFIADLVGQGWDIIGFDTRGTGYSKPNGAVGYGKIPLAPELQNASSTRADRAIKRSVTTDFGIKIPASPDSWVQKQYELGTELDTLIQKNANADNQAVPYMTTPNVAFDMLQIAKANARSQNISDEDVLVNFYGISYGTVLGQTFASLYPQHVGRFVLDGVVDINDYYSGNVGLTRFDEGLSTFFARCFDAGPEGCSFYTGQTQNDIRDRFNSLMAQLDSSKAVSEKWKNATIIQETRDVIRGLLMSAPYDAISNFSLLADSLTVIEGWVKADALLENRETILQLSPNPFSLPSRLEYFFEIQCSDMNNPLVGSKQLSKNIIDSMRHSSVVAGETFIGQYAVCSRLQLKAKWKFDGKIGGDTKNPMLFIGSSGDPATPFENAEVAQKRYKGSQMVYVEADAHGIIGQSNKCVHDNVKAYLENLTLPGRNNRCGRDGEPLNPSEKSSAGLSTLESLNTFGRGMCLMLALVIGADVFHYVM
ncbi:hypothetical protein TWF679_005566 [Orbilia oligospora]|uniref:AB hydrolase-1 domain-containing protein n=1 Tax=Orbilia oligospora TaxID=2813651 RepID=A0A8H8VBV0_ORBOL|nr:hypothetical protein TWF679_005566 [Orbilia oligospora]